jgi:hypothetical protein
MRKEIRDRRDAIARKLLHEQGFKWLDALAKADKAIRCGAKTRAGTPCQRVGLPQNGRCIKHAGAATGPRTPEGKEASRQAVIRRHAARRAEKARMEAGNG